MGMIILVLLKNSLRKNQVISTISTWILIGSIFFYFIMLPGITNIKSVSASIIIVDSKGNGNYTTIQTAINNANTGDIICVWDGIYYEHINIAKTLTLIGNGSGNTIIHGNYNLDVVNITSNWVNITGFTVCCSGNQSLPNGYAGIKLFNVQNVNIKNNNLSNNFFGIYLTNSNFNIIKDNNLINNSNGILLYYSNNNKINNNNISSNSFTSIHLDYSHSNLITNNTCNSNGFEGMWLKYSNMNYIMNNTCNLNFYEAIAIRSSNSNIVKKNICLNNTNGIFIDLMSSLDNYPSLNLIDNNNCSSNSYGGIVVTYSTQTIIVNNTCLNNTNGIVLFETYQNMIKNNTCNVNLDDGIYLYESVRNRFINNTISKNKDGIFLELNSEYNKIFENNISFNTNNGFLIRSNCKNNLIYHNIIESNKQQAYDSGENNWDFDNEGNYWSDYTGLDNGANGRWKGDSIGDTDIPHPGPGYDNYPFIMPYGWLYLAIPNLISDSDLDPDGNYSISWFNDSRANGYILEEDTEKSFNSKTEYSDGWEVQDNYNVITFTNKGDGTYYYRIKAFNDKEVTKWSDIVNITVDFPPNIPQDFNVSANLNGNMLNLTWTQNFKDTTKYCIYCLENSMWKHLINISHPITYYNHNNLIDGKLYSYKICALDSRNQSSGFSKIVSGIPKDSIAPKIPTGLNATAISDSEILLTWRPNFDADIAGYLVYINLTKDINGDYKLLSILNNSFTSYLVSNLKEQVTYYFKLRAFDEVPNNSSFSGIAFATPPDETYPQPPSGLKITNVTYYSLIIKWKPNPESDILGYIIYRSDSPKTNYKNISELINNTNYLDTGLEENTIYYYKLIALDDANQSSYFSNYTYAITKIGPKPPEINNTISNLELIEDTNDESSINLYHLFKDINNDPLVFRCEGQEHINVTIDQETGKVILIPEKNWNGDENLTFYASDGTFEISENLTVIVTGMNDPPGFVNIIKPKDNSIFSEDEKIEFQGECFDPDLLYGDEITFTWYSWKDGELGKGKNLTGIKLSPSRHNITLEVKDKFGKTSENYITLTVLKKDDNVKDGKENLIMISVGVIILIAIIVLILFLVTRTRKKKQKETSKKDSKQKIRAPKEENSHELLTQSLEE